MVSVKCLCSYTYTASDNSRMDIYLDAVIEPNKPVGSISITLTNPEEYSTFVQGKEYTMEFKELSD